MSQIKLYLYASEASLRSILKSGKIRLSKPWNTNDITECVAKGEKDQSELIKTYGYICLSSTKSSPAMWGYYADRSRGACIEFTFSYTYHTVDLFPCGGGYAHKVKYSDERVDPNETVELLITKSKSWEYEKEYRILYKLNKRPVIDVIEGDTIQYYTNDIKENVTGIILGKNCKIQLSELKTIIRSSAIHTITNISRACLDSNSFNFDVVTFPD